MKHSVCRTREISIYEEKMQLREYITSDCEQLAKIFYQTVHMVNAKDYTKEQLDVWATGTVDLKELNKSFLKHLTIVAILLRPSQLDFQRI